MKRSFLLLVLAALMGCGAWAPSVTVSGSRGRRVYPQTLKVFFFNQCPDTAQITVPGRPIDEPVVVPYGARAVITKTIYPSEDPRNIHMVFEAIDNEIEFEPISVRFSMSPTQKYEERTWIVTRKKARARGPSTCTSKVG